MLLIDIPRYQQLALDQAPPVSFDVGFWELFECQKVSDYIISKSFNRETSKRLKWME